MDENRVPPEGTGPPPGSTPDYGQPSPPPPGPPPAYGQSSQAPPPGYPAGYGQPPGPPPRTGGQGTAALLLGIFGIVGCCHVVSPVAWYLGQDEIKDIRSGRVVASETNAKVGMILGMVGTGLLVIDIMWGFFFGGLAMVAEMLGNMGGHLGGHF